MFFERRGLRRSYAVLVVIICVIIAVLLFLIAIVPVITDQVKSITDQAPGWFDRLQNNQTVQDLDDEYDVINKARDYVTGGDFVGTLFGGALGIGLAVLGALFNAFIILVLTLYFLSSLSITKGALYRLAPASRRDRVSRLGDRIIESVGGYVSGAFIVAVCAGLSSLVFLFIVGLGKYAVALAFVVFLLDVIPMIGATIAGAILVLATLTQGLTPAVIMLIIVLVYQQFENYVLQPTILGKAADVSGFFVIVSVMIFGALLGVIGAIIAVPIIASIQIVVKELTTERRARMAALRGPPDGTADTATETL
jgi:predicted PurR-regulated permease PerM